MRLRDGKIKGMSRLVLVAKILFIVYKNCAQEGTI
jgi:hypothetical protein